MLLKTNAAKRHWHVVYWNDPQQVGVTSEDKGHRHNVLVNEYGDITVVAADDGHTHDEILELEVQEMKDKEESKVVSEVIALYKAASETEKKSREKADVAEQFYCGEQWDKTDSDNLKAQQRACLVVNQVEGLVDTLSGYQRQNRQDIRFLPIEGGDQKTADLLTLVMKNIADQNGLEHEETMVFESQVINGRGLFHTYVDDQGELPDIKIEAFPHEDVWFGPHSRPDLKDLEYMVKARWMSPAQASNLWPEYADQIESKYSNMFEDAAGDLLTDPHNADKQAAYSGESQPITDFNTEIVNIAKKEIRVVELWRKEYYSAPMYSSGTPGEIAQDLGKFSRDIQAKAATIPGADVTWKKRSRMRLTICVGKILVEDGYPDLPLGVEYPIHVAYAKYRKGSFWGKVESAKDPQRETNKRHSQTVDILNKMSAYGWFIDSNTFQNQQDLDKFKANSSRPGFVQVVADTGRLPVKVEGVKFPNELVQLEELSVRQFHQVTGVQPDYMNQRDISGSALIEKRRQGMTQNEYLFDNLAQAKRRMAKTVVAWIQKVYTPERIARIVMGKATPEQQIDGQPSTDFTEGDIAAIFADADLTRYDVAVSESAWNPTMRRSNFQAWSELARGGLAVPPAMLVDLSDLPNKAQVKASFEAQAAAAQQAQDEKTKMELGKTIIAKGGDPSALISK